jgi:hypothetical protein
VHDALTSTAPVDESRQRELGFQAAGLEAANTSHAARTIPTCREACGGGFLTEDRLPQLEATPTCVVTTPTSTRVVLEAVVAGAERCTDPSARALLKAVCDLCALSTVEADKGWFLEHGRLTPARSKASGPR